MNSGAGPVIVNGRVVPPVVSPQAMKKEVYEGKEKQVKKGSAVQRRLAKM